MSQWQPDVRLTNHPAGSWTSYNNAWCVASSGTVVHVVWYDNRNGINNSEIYYKRSTDGGVTWGVDTRLTNNDANSELPSVAVSGSFVHVVWMDLRDGNYEIYYKRSTNAGVNWGADTRLTNNSGESSNPSVSVSGLVVHVVWKDNRDLNDEIYYKRSTDGGENWEAEIRLTNYNAESGSPSVAVSGSVVHVVWEDTRDGNREIYYKRSTNGGISWGSDVRLTLTSGSSEHSSLAVSGSVVHVVWKKNSDGNNEIYYKRSSDTGVSWGADTRLTNNNASSNFPSVIVSGPVVHVVWTDDREGNFEIYYKRSIDVGVSWGADTRLTNNSAYSYYPSVSVSGSVVHVVWMDLRDGNYEVYYKRDPTGNPIGIINISSEIPSSYSLEQNYPNPFNPTTKIKFDIPALSFPNAPIGNPLVVLKVFDILGKEIATLVNEQLAPGTYSVDFDATNFPSGVYFYQLSISDEQLAVKKMILLK